jgi:hypothetical protein
MHVMMNDLLPLKKLQQKQRTSTKVRKEGKKKKVIQFMVSTLMLANWVQN